MVDVCILHWVLEWSKKLVLHWEGARERERATAGEVKEWMAPERERENDVTFSRKNICTVRVKREDMPLRCTPHKL